MTIRSVGYGGTIGEIDWSVYLAPYVGSPEMVGGVNDFAVTPVSGLTVQVAPGLAHAYGVTDVSDATETLQLEPVTAGDRYDVVVLNRDWSGASTTPAGVATGGRTTITYRKGGASLEVPKVPRNPGNVAEQPLALVKVSAGSTTVQRVADLRATHAKAAYVRSLLAMTGAVGTRYTLEPDNRRYVMVPGASGLPEPKEEWEPPAPAMPTVPIVKSGTAAVDFSSGFGDGVGHINHGLGRRPSQVFVQARTTMSSSLVDVTLSTQPGSINNIFFAVVAKIVDPAAPGWKAYTGNLTYVDWIAVG